MFANEKVILPEGGDQRLRLREFVVEAWQGLIRLHRNGLAKLIDEGMEEGSSTRKQERSQGAAGSQAVNATRETQVLKENVSVKGNIGDVRTEGLTFPGHETRPKPKDNPEDNGKLLQSKKRASDFWRADLGHIEW